MVSVELKQEKHNALVSFLMIVIAALFLLYALDGLSLAEIGVLCGCSKVAVYQSVEAVRKKFINFFENRLNE